MTVAPVFSDLHWYRLQCKLVNIRTSPSITSHPISIFDAIVKGTTTRMYRQYDINEHLIFFHCKNQGCRLRIYPGATFLLEVLFCGKSADEVRGWAEALKEYLADPETGKNFSLIAISAPQQRNLALLIAESGITRTGGEICLEFLTPFPFKPAQKKNRTFINNEVFINALIKRFTRLLGREITYRSSADRFFLLPYYWHYTEIRHKAKSQPGYQLINGCVGKLYIKGSFADLLPLLILGSELHIGTKLANAQGYYLLHQDSPPYFVPGFPALNLLEKAVDEVLDRYDSPILTFSQDSFNRDSFVRELFQELSQGTYQPGPNQAFRIKKKDGGERVVERLSLKDLIVQHYCLKTIQPVFERIFEPESIGYRKGISRERAVEMVRQAIAEGYQYVIESDIEDFFPSVDLNLLCGLIDHYLPEKDVAIREILKRCINAGYILDQQLYPRQKGLAQGAPLSPLLANLYLDSFDEKLKSLNNLRLIRFADDFIILTRTREDARAILDQAQSYLSEINLNLNPSKTRITPIRDGFQFLGIRFERSEAVVEPEAEFRRMKKPLYITEPYLYLTVNGEAVEIRRRGAPVEIIPLRRLSEIMVMEKSLFSTALIRKCTELNIPVTITLNNGYYITTVKPDSKNYYEILSAHNLRFSTLSETELLCFGREIATAKINNYLSLFRQKYQPGFNLILSELNEAISRIEQAGTIDEVRGQEGAIARRIYQHLNLLIDNPVFHITTRRRKKPDRINSLLNFGYYLLFSRINATLRALGLNPYLGFLHSHSDNYESLAADLCELFRARVDRFVIRLLNLKTITPDHFLITRDGAYLRQEPVKKFIDQYEKEMAIKQNPDRLSLEEQIYLQGLVIKKWALGQGSLTFYRWNL